MSHPPLPSTNRPYDVVRVCQQWGVSRSTFYAQPGHRVSPLHKVRLQFMASTFSTLPQIA